MNSVKKEKILYHGSAHIIETPTFGMGKEYNDYGSGFYCTEHLDLACEWACTSIKGGFANKYVLNMEELSNLLVSEMHILTWLAVLIENRSFELKSELALEAKNYLIEEFSVDISSYDIITGYRADDSYFAFATGFLNGSLSLNQLSRAMQLGTLGEQIVMKSEKAFQNLRFQGYEEVGGESYYTKRMERDCCTRTAFQAMRGEQRASQAIYIIDILRERWKSDDVRLQ